jgi:hypothetical protein
MIGHERAGDVCSGVVKPLHSEHDLQRFVAFLKKMCGEVLAETGFCAM